MIESNHQKKKWKDANIYQFQKQEKCQKYFIFREIQAFRIHIQNQTLLNNWWEVHRNHNKSDLISFDLQMIQANHQLHFQELAIQKYSQALEQLLEINSHNLVLLVVDISLSIDKGYKMNRVSDLHLQDETKKTISMDRRTHLYILHFSKIKNMPKYFKNLNQNHEPQFQI